MVFLAELRLFLKDAFSLHLNKKHLSFFNKRMKEVYKQKRDKLGAHLFYIRANPFPMTRRNKKEITEPKLK